MATAARLDIGAWRYETCTRRIRVVGQDLTGADLVMEIRLQPDTPGAAQVALSKTPNGVGDVIRFVGLEAGASIVTSVVEFTISGATMANNNALPYAGEVGSNMTFAYAIRFGAVTRLYGAFIALAAVIGSDNAPSSRPAGNGSGGNSATPWETATATLTGDQITVTLEGAAALAPLVQAAKDAAVRAETAAAGVTGVAQTVSTIALGGAPVDPRDYELWTALEGATRLVITSDNYLVFADSFLDTPDGPTSGETLADIMARPGPVVSSRDIVAVGDSFAEQLLAEEAAKAYGPLIGQSTTFIKPYNLGYSSHTSHAVATRINAFAANYKPVGGVIPADTTPYELIPENVELRAGPVQVFSGGSDGGRAPVYYGRVEHEFFYQGGKPMVQRKAAGKAIPINDFTPLVCIPYAKNITPKTAVNWRALTVLINFGRNNINGYGAARLVAEDTAVVSAVIAAIRAWCPCARIALMPIWPNRAPGSPIDEPYGSDQRNKVDAVNANRLAMWPELYCDTLTPAINNYDTASGDRLDDFNKGYTARAYRLKYDIDGTTVVEDTLHAGNYVTPGRKSGQQLEGVTAANFLFARYS